MNKTKLSLALMLIAGAFLAGNLPACSKSTPATTGAAGTSGGAGTGAAGTSDAAVANPDTALVPNGTVVSAPSLTQLVIGLMQTWDETTPLPPPPPAPPAPPPPKKSAKKPVKKTAKAAAKNPPHPGCA